MPENSIIDGTILRDVYTCIKDTKPGKECLNLTLSEIIRLE